MKTVSIIIPIYNVEKYLPVCLDSVVRQTYSDIEIICVDDGSPDGSAAVIRSYMEKDSRIRMVSQKNQGLSGARNTGVKNANGEYIMFLDGDDWIDLQTVEFAVKAIEKENADAVMWGYVREFADKSVEKRILNGNKVFGKEETKNFVQRRMAGLLDEELAHPEDADSLVTAWGKLYKTEIIKSNSLEYIDTKIIGTEDALFSLQYFGFVEKCVFLDKPFNHYRKDNDVSLTRTYKKNLSVQWLNLYRIMDLYIIENNCPQSFSRALDNRVCLSIIGLGLTELSNPSGITARIKNIRKFLSAQRYRSAYKNLTLRYFPIHWKLFFFCCKLRLSVAVYLMLLGINYIIEK